MYVDFFGGGVERHGQCFNVMKPCHPKVNFVSTIGSQFLTHVNHGFHDNMVAPRKTNMDTQDDGLEKVTPKRNGNCWYLCLCEISGV